MPLLAIALITLLSCNNQNKIPENFDFGQVSNGLYTNDYFEMEVHFDPNWAVQNKEEMNNLIEMGNELVSEGDEEMKKLIEASKVNTAYLLTVFKYEVGTPVEFNPSFMIIAENTKNFSRIKDGGDYLVEAKKTLKQTPMNYSFNKPVYEKIINNTSYHILEAELSYVGKSITQEYISTVKNGFSLLFTLSYSTEEEKSELYKVLNKIKMK
ncbi:hypothetical protein SAMN05216474_0468 [Lishizhenia tianjinensis]|uniref:Uncharacterized protein n=2 Tax=Lishizhenia tianjinensis TaxID=477690 RepID=A0A1I6XUI8_9FLAO|nr:hypothetical protein SAMN05216474_0468 [Lishizhenia tianjinensis]